MTYFFTDSKKDFAYGIENRKLDEICTRAYHAFKDGLKKGSKHAVFSAMPFYQQAIELIHQNQSEFSNHDVAYVLFKAAQTLKRHPQYNQPYFESLINSLITLLEQDESLSENNYFIAAVKVIGDAGLDLNKGHWIDSSLDLYYSIYNPDHFTKLNRLEMSYKQQAALGNFDKALHFVTEAAAYKKSTSQYDILIIKRRQVRLECIELIEQFKSKKIDACDLKVHLEKLLKDVWHLIDHEKEHLNKRTIKPKHFCDTLSTLMIVQSLINILSYDSDKPLEITGLYIRNQIKKETFTKDKSLYTNLIKIWRNKKKMYQDIENRHQPMTIVQKLYEHRSPLAIDFPGFKKAVTDYKVTFPKPLGAAMI